MKKLIAAVSLVYSAAFLQAQEVDSLALSSNAFYQPIEAQLAQTPLLFTDQRLGNYTQTQLDFQHDNLAFKRVQTAEKKQAYNFRTRGIYNFDPSLRVTGSILFSKSEEQNVGYTLGSERTLDQEVLTPNYFLVPKKGDWSNQHYHLAAGVSKSFASRYLLGATVHYKNDKYIRTIDPRPQITSHDFGGKIHAGIQANGHRIYGYAGWQQATDTESISYVNQWQNAPVYPETYTRFSSGYGRLLYSNTYSNHLFRTSYEQVGAGYHYQKAAHQLYINYAYEKSMRDLYARDANGNVYIDESLITHKYRTITYAGDANYLYTGANQHYKAQVRYKNSTGDNYSVLENGQNYRTTQQAVGGTLGVFKKNEQRVHYRLEAYADYHQNRYTDLLGYTDKKITSLTTGFIAGTDVWSKTKHRLYLETDVSYYQALDEGVIYNPTSTQSYFAEGLLFPDHAYDATSRLQTSLQARYTMQLSKQRELGLFVRYHAIEAIGDAYESYYPNLSTQTTSFWQMGLTLSY